MGRAVVVLQDLDGDGVNEFAISSPTCSDNAGCVWISGSSDRQLSVESQVAMVTDDLDGLFGGSTAVGLGTTIRPAADLDGDGLEDVLITGRNDDIGAYGAWLFTGLGDPSTWTRTTDDATASWELTYSGEQLSTECDAGVDVDGDGHADVIIGEQGYEEGAASGGAALLYLGGADLRGRYTDGDAFATIYGATAGARAGAAVALGGDASGDGLGDIAVGLPMLGSPGGAVALWWGGPRVGE